MCVSFCLKMYLIVFIFLFIFTDQVKCQFKISDITIDEDCLKCICTANTGCRKEITECFEDSNETIRCGMFLIKESQWIEVIENNQINFRQSNLSNFEECYSNYKCSSDLINAYTLIHLTSIYANMNYYYDNKLNEFNTLNNLKCGDIAFFNQFGHSNQYEFNKFENFSSSLNKIELQYTKVLKTHQCMNNNLNEFKIKFKNYLDELNYLNKINNQINNNQIINNQLNKINQINQTTLINRINLVNKNYSSSSNNNNNQINSNQLFQNRISFNSQQNVSIVPRKCFDCIRSANNYNSQNSDICFHPLQKCGPYAINFEYYLKVDGNEIIKQVLPKLYNKTSEIENQNQLLDTIDLLNKVSNIDNKQFRKEVNTKSDDEFYLNNNDENSNLNHHKIDYNKKLSELLNFDYNLSIETQITNNHKPKKTSPNDENFDYNQSENYDYNNPILGRSLQFIQYVNNHKPKQSTLKRKNSKLLSKLVNKTSKINNNNQVLKSRRNSKFSKENQSLDLELNSSKSISINEESSVQKLITTASYLNFANCAINLKCSEQLINHYVKQHLNDCNLDSTIDCDDFASIHWLGVHCKKQNAMLYSNLWKNFEYCSILSDEVRKEELNYYELSNDFIKENLSLTQSDKDSTIYNSLPIFQARPNLQSQFNITNESTFQPSDLNQYQYYSSHVVDLSTDCLQCICESSSDNYNCTQILNPSSSSLYFSVYKFYNSFDPNLFAPPPPQIVYLKTNNRMPKFLKYLNRDNYKSPEEVNRVTKELDEKDFLAINDDKEKVKNCDNGCGPFGITKMHFLESMINTFWYRGAAGDYERCAESIDCSIETISKFVTKFPMDCTKDGRLSCADFGLIHKFKNECADLNVLNTEYYRKFEKCLLRLGLH